MTMRGFAGWLAACFLLGLTGCSDDRITRDDYGPTVDAFTGRVVQDGKPVDFSGDRNVVLQVIWQEKAERFGIPLKPDGSFQIGYMPVGKYTAILEREQEPQAGSRRGSTIPPYTIPDGLKIEEGKTDYTIELGKSWKH